ncbi:hypothetical protein ACWDUM_02925 [Rhodococcus sp. NPDC003322]
MIDAQTLDVPAVTTKMQTGRRWVPGACVWCGDEDAVDMYRNEPRCGTCREKEEIIEGARRFLGMYGLRPLGGTLQSDDEEEREWRVNARDARQVLNQIKLATPPDPALVRKALRPRAAAVVAESPTAASRSASASGSASPARSTRTAATPPPAPVRSDAVDLEEIQSRALALLDQMTQVDAQLAQVADQAGLAARARRSDLEKQKATIMRTLGALEKARLSAQR